MRLTLLSVVVGVGLASCGRERAHSVLLVTLDTTRTDALGAYGCSPSVTPNIDRLAAGGVLFEQAYTVAPLTLPAHASMLTGLFPPRHGVRDNGVAPLPQSAVTLAERAREAGFQTAAFLGSAVLDEGFGLEQGFDRYEAPARSFYGAPRFGYSERPAAEVAGLAAAWLHARDPRRPFFLWVHLWDPHGPYEPPPEIQRRTGNNAYLGEIAACDLALGRMLAALAGEKVADSTLVVVVADHGEAFAEHDELTHGAYVWNTTMRVPLLLRLPGGRRAGERVSAIASVADVYPTALAAMGLAEDEIGGVDGVNLLDDEPGAERGTYFESYYGYLNYGWHPLTGWVDPAGKYVHGPGPRLFDPRADPKELEDLLATDAQLAARHRAALAALAGVTSLARDAEGLDPELKRSLQAVGYAALADGGAEVPEPLAALALPDPHERTQEHLEFQKASGRMAAGEYEQAEALLRTIVTRNPGHHAGWDRLAVCLMRLNRHAEAIAALERVLAGSPGNADTWSYLAACRLVTGDEEKALTAFTRALELDPNHVQALGGLVQLMEAAGLGAKVAPFRKRFEAVQSRP